MVQWLQPGQVLAALDEGMFGYRRVQTVDVPLGADYGALYPEHPTVEVALFERPQFAADPLLFGEVLALHDAILPPEVPPGGRLHIDLWWAARAPEPRLLGRCLPAADGCRHRAGAGRRRAGRIGHHDLGSRVAMFDRHTLLTPDDLPPGEYRVALTVYWYGDMQPLAVEGGPRAVIGTVAVR